MAEYIDWSRYRRPDGTIDLIHVFEVEHSYMSASRMQKALQFIEKVERMQPIKSRILTQK